MNPDIQSAFDTEDGQPPDVGADVTGTTHGPWFAASWSGRYCGIVDTPSTGEPYYMFAGGEVNGQPQVMFGFPVGQFQKLARMIAREAS